MWKAERVTDLMQVIAESSEDSYFTSRPCQEPSIGRQRIERAEEAQAVNEITAEGIDGDHAFGLEFAEGDMDRPLVRACGAQAVIGEVDALADAHAGLAEQQEDISAKIVAAHELLLEELILLCGERPWQSLRRARDIFAPQQVSEFSQMAGPSQLVEDGAQSDEASDAGCRGQRRSLCAQVRHPSEDVRIAAQLFETGNLRVFGAQIDEEAAHRDVVVAFGGRSECGGQRLDRAREGRSQRMLERRTAPALHGDPRLRMDALRRGAGVLKIDVLRGDLHIVQGGFDVGVAHQLHQRGQADAGAHHIRGEGMSEAVRVGQLTPVVRR